MASKSELIARANERGATFGMPHLGELISAVAMQNGIEPEILLALIDFESGFNPKARSPAGALGLGQVMPFHFQPGEDPFDPYTNITKSASLLRGYTDMVGGNIGLGLAAYFAGPGAVQKAGGQVPEGVADVNVDAKTYVRRVLTNADRADLIEQTPGLGSTRRPPGLAAPLGGTTEATPMAEDSGIGVDTPIGRPKLKWWQRLMLFLGYPGGEEILRTESAVNAQRDQNLQTLLTGMQTGTLSATDVERVLDSAPIGKYETAEERDKRQTLKTRGIIQAGQLQAQAASAQAKMGDLTREEQARAQAAEILRQQTEAQKAQTGLTAAIAYLTQQIAAGNLTAREAENEARKITEKNTATLRLAEETGRRIADANTQFIEASKYALPPGTQYVPGLEPGGAVQSVVQGFGHPERTFTPFPARIVNYNPYNQLAPSANVQLSEYAPAEPAQRAAIEAGFDAVRRLLQSVGVNIPGGGVATTTPFPGGLPTPTRESPSSLGGPIP